MVFGKVRQGTVQADVRGIDPYPAGRRKRLGYGNRARLDLRYRYGDCRAPVDHGMFPEKNGFSWGASGDGGHFSLDDVKNHKNRQGTQDDRGQQGPVGEQQLVRRTAFVLDLDQV